MQKILGPSKYAIYFMQDNIYLGECISIVYRASAREIKENGLSGENIVIAIKPFNQPRIKEKSYSISELLEKGIFTDVKPLLLRVASECTFGIFGDSHCDCEAQRQASLNAISLNGQGIYIHLPQEAQGQGLFYKAKELALQVTGHSPEGNYIGEQSVTSASTLLLGDSPLDIRRYTLLKSIFNELGLNKYKYSLISSNSRKIDSISKELGINIVDSIDVSTQITKHNIGEYLGKLYNSNQVLDDKELTAILEILKNDSTVPERVKIQLAYIKDDLSDGRRFNANHKLLHELTMYAKSEVKTLDSILKTNRSLREFTPSPSDYLLEIKETGFETSILTDNSIFIALSKIYGEKFIDYCAIENQKYYDLLDNNSFKDVGREVKVRTTENIIGLKKDVIRRLIYKKLINNSERNYETINIDLDNQKVFEAFESIPLYQLTKEYEMISHICQISDDLLIIIKTLPMFEYLVDFKGDHKTVENVIEKIASIISIEKDSAQRVVENYDKISVFIGTDREKLIKRERSFSINHIK